MKKKAEASGMMPDGAFARRSAAGWRGCFLALDGLRRRSSGSARRRDCDRAAALLPGPAQDGGEAERRQGQDNEGDRAV